MARRQVESLVEVREHRGATQAEVAERLGVSQSAISKIEHRPDPSLVALRDYIGALGGELVVLIRFGNQTFEYVGGASEPPRSR